MASPSLTSQEREEFGRYLRELREKAHLTQQEAANSVDISPGFLALVEQGRRNAPKPAVLEKLAVAYKVEYDELLEKAGWFNTTITLYWPEPNVPVWSKKGMRAWPIEPERFLWARECIRCDPNVVIPKDEGPSDMGAANTAYLIFEYQRLTGRTLLTPKEQTGLLYLVERGGYDMAALMAKSRRQDRGDTPRRWIKKNET